MYATDNLMKCCYVDGIISFSVLLSSITTVSLRHLCRVVYIKVPSTLIRDNLCASSIIIHLGINCVQP